MIASEGTIRTRTLDYIRDHPYLSAYQIAKATGDRCDSVSSTLSRLTKQGAVNRTKSGGRKGPRGGYVYWMYPHA